MKSKLGKQAKSSQAEFNGESVQRDMDRERKVQGVRAGIAGLGFVMAVVGLWGDRPLPRAVVAVR